MGLIWGTDGRLLEAENSGTESKGILSLSGVPLHRDFRSRPHRLHGEVLNLWPLARIREEVHLPSHRETFSHYHHTIYLF